MAIAPLHVRSGYSLCRGTALPARLVERARRLGHTCLALTDVNNLCAATHFWKQACRAGLRPILGAELRCGRCAAVALVAADVGYENLCRAISRIHRRGANLPEEDGALIGDLAELSEGLHVLVEDAGIAGKLLAAGMEAGRLWLGIDPATQPYAQIRRLVDCGGRLGVGLAATGRALLADPVEYEAARLLAAIRSGCTYEEAQPRHLPHPKAFLKSPGVLAGQLVELPRAARNNERLVEECSAFRLLPREPVFPRFSCPDGLSAAMYLRRLCYRGMQRRYGPLPPEPARQRLERELRLIDRLGFSEYFLVVWDIVRYARRHNAPVAGRGSGASSIVAYALGITNVCPIAYDIPFERFLHEQREDFPDLDVDFCWRIRDDAIDYAFDRWGTDHVAMVCTHNTFQPRSAFRETAKAVGLSNDQISRMMERGDYDGRSEHVAALSRQIVGLPHLLSVHPGGIVITRRPVDHYVPVQPAPKGVMITQYDKNGIEDIRLVKLDLLGNRNLSTIRYACDLIAARTGNAIDIEALPTDDPATIGLLRSADTVGCNQLESPAMRHLLRMMQPGDTRDVMKILALIRPGAASIGMKEVFVRRHRGLSPVPPAPPQVEGLLRNTCGVMLYEDDVMLVAAAMIGSNLPEADRFRKAVQTCSDDRRRLELSRRFLRRCTANGIDLEFAKSMWVQMAKFNAYSFCRAHAASYALLAYAGAYLRTHYPLEFWVACLNNNQSMYHPRVYVEHAKRDGVTFLLPDVNRSEEEFSLDGGAVRVGLNFVAGLGPAGIERILKQRRRRPFEGLSDFLYRTRLGEAEARALILCGAFDAFGRTRPTRMMELHLFLAGRGGEHPGGATLLPAAPTIPDAPGDYDDRRKALNERRVLGISVRGHVMALFRPVLKGQVDADSRLLPERIGRRVRIAGVLEARRSTPTQSGRKMLFLTFEDEFGLFEVTVFPGALKRLRRGLNRYGPYVVSGKVEDQYGAVTISAESIALVRGAGTEAEQPVASFAPTTGKDTHE
jgi:DNA-directed DNA polymerase III PolC